MARLLILLTLSALFISSCVLYPNTKCFRPLWRSEEIQTILRSGANLYNSALSGIYRSCGLPSSSEPSHEEFTLKLTHVLHHGAKRSDLFRILTAEGGANADSLLKSGKGYKLKAKLARENIQAAGYLPEYLDVTGERNSLLPDVTDRSTIYTLAKMSYDAYTRPNDGDWIDLGSKWNTTYDWGWANDGLRGYVFSSEERKLAVIVFKGTSANFLGIGGPSSPNDKLNDNRMFSCCCAKVSPVWRNPVCDCATGSSTCNSTCLSEVAKTEDSYFSLSKHIYDFILEIFPQSEIWLTGHSLGGAVASTLSLYTQNARQSGVRAAPAITFNSPGERLYAERLGLRPDPSDVMNMGRVPQIWHFGVSADVIFTGQCTLPTNICWLAGYAMETKCHVGHECVWQVTGMGSVQYHLIAKIIRDFVGNDALPLPQCRPVDPNCKDCERWSFS